MMPSNQGIDRELQNPNKGSDSGQPGSPGKNCAISVISRACEVHPYNSMNNDITGSTLTDWNVEHFNTETLDIEKSDETR
jgi:hypothetical protein